ncbi:Hypothetical predicted protein [Lecanosticta acicola]|uniref:Uncharacterized protein n=1 Tax=Lecanosticta acicola TaxID=111012 RepID=A0AAI9E720_9PEZI|nr:Hypothetical predicted protein [Lecanosticta acicola]
MARREAYADIRGVEDEFAKTTIADVKEERKDSSAPNGPHGKRKSVTIAMAVVPGDAPGYTSLSTNALPPSPAEPATNPATSEESTRRIKRKSGRGDLSWHRKKGRPPSPYPSPPNTSDNGMSDDISTGPPLSFPYSSMRPATMHAIPAEAGLFFSDHADAHREYFGAPKRKASGLFRNFNGDSHVAANGTRNAFAAAGERSEQRSSIFSTFTRQFRSKSLGAFGLSSKRKREADEPFEGPTASKRRSKLSISHTRDYRAHDIDEFSGSNINAADVDAESQMGAEETFEGNAEGSAEGKRNTRVFTHRPRRRTVTTTLPSGQSIDPDVAYRRPSPVFRDAAEESRHRNNDAMAALEGRTRMVEHIDEETPEYRSFARRYKSSKFAAANEREEMMTFDGLQKKHKSVLPAFTFETAPRFNPLNDPEVESAGPPEPKRPETMPAQHAKRTRTDEFPFIAGSEKLSGWQKQAMEGSVSERKDMNTYDAMDVDYEVDWRGNKRTVSSYILAAEDNIWPEQQEDVDEAL